VSLLGRPFDVFAFEGRGLAPLYYIAKLSSKVEAKFGPAGEGNETIKETEVADSR